MDSLVAANVRQRPLRTAISVTGVALGVILVALTVGLANGMMRNTAERQAKVQAEIMFYPSGGMASSTGGALTLDTVYARAIAEGTPRIEAVSGVSGVTPVAQYLQTSSSGIGFEILEGVDFARYPEITGMRLAKGRWPAGKEVVVDVRYAAEKKALDGQPIGVGSEILVFGVKMPVSGIYEPEIGARVKMPIDTMQRFVVGGAERASFLLVKCQDPNRQELVAGELRAKYPNNRVVMTRDLPNIFAGSIGSLQVFLKVVIWLSAVVSTLVILLAMYTTITERTREIGVLKSLGASKVWIVTLIEKEALLIAVLGILVGLGVSVVGKWAIESATTLHIDLEPKWILISAAIGLASSALGALYPAARAAAQDPVKALSYE